MALAPTYTLTVDLVGIAGVDTPGIDVTVSMAEPGLVFPVGQSPNTETLFPGTLSGTTDASGIATFRLLPSSVVGNYLVSIGNFQRGITMPAADSRLSALGEAAPPGDIGSTFMLTTMSNLAPNLTDAEKAVIRGKIGIGADDLAAPAYADNTAYSPGQIVRYGTNVFMALVAIPDTNTTAPVDGATWRKLTLPPPASRTLAGIVEIADNSELDGAAADNVAVSPKGFPRILKGLLKGRETDQFSSYDNALFGGGYWPGGFCLFDRNAEPTDDTDAIGQPDIASGSGVIAWGDLRDDSDPDAAFTPEALVAARWPAGKVIYLVPWHPFAAGVELAVTLTTAAQKSGAGNGERLWAEANWVLTGAISPNEVGDYFRWSEYSAGDVAVDSAVITALAPLLSRLRALPNFAAAHASSLAGYLTASPAPSGRAALMTALVTAFEGMSAALLKRLRLLWQGNNESQTLTATRVEVTPSAAGQLYIASPNHGFGQLLFWPPATLKDGTTPFSLADLKEFQSGDFLDFGAVRWEIGDTPWQTFQNSVLTASVMLADGYTFDAADLPAVNAAADFRLEGRDLHIGLVVAAILKRAAVNLGGKGGAAGKVWAYLSSGTNATWRRLLDVLKADADTAAKRADYRAALNTGRLDKDIAGAGALALTAAELGHNLIALSGAKTGDRILSIPANNPVGVLAFRNESTGPYVTMIKTSGQADAAALVIPTGDHLFIALGGAIGKVGESPQPPSAGTHRTGSHTLAAGDIGKWNSFFAQNASLEISLSGALGVLGDRLVLACRSQGNVDVDLKWVSGTLKVYSARGIATLESAGTAELIGTGGNQRAVYTAIKSGASEWMVYEGVWGPS